MKFKHHMMVTLPSLLMLSGCANYISNVSDTFKLAVLGTSDVTVPEQKIESIPYPSAYLKMGDASQSFIVLGYAEDNKLKWITADNNMIVTANGRIVKTIGFDEDIAHVEIRGQDPLSDIFSLKNSTKKYNGRMYWSEVYRGGYDFNSIVSYANTEEIEYRNKKVTVIKIEEKLYFNALNKSYVNQYWYDAKTGVLLKSLQHMGPGLVEVAFTVLKPYDYN